MTRTIKLIIAASITLTLLLLFTDPRKMPSIVLIVPFLLLFIILSLGAASILRRYVARTRRLRLSFIIGAFPVLLLVLLSLGQLTMRDTLAIVALFLIAYFYISRFGVQASR